MEDKEPGEFDGCVWSYEPPYKGRPGALIVTIGCMRVICPDVGVRLKRMVELTIDHIRESGYV